jgi:RND family efflux transporter MFP subunit
MVIPKKFLSVSFIIIILVVLGYFFVLKKAPAKPGGDANAPAAAATKAGGGTTASPGSGQTPADKAEAAPLTVKAVPARRGELIIKLKSPGEAFTDSKIALKAEVGGVVRNLAVVEGKHVKAGDVLLELEDREYKLRLDKADALRLRYLSDLFLEQQYTAEDKALTPAALARLAKSEADFKTATESFAKGTITAAEYEKAQKDYEVELIQAGRKKDEIMASAKGLTQQEIDVKLARMDLDKTIVRAPFPGIITDIKISPRERLDPGRELFTLVDISRIRVKAKVLESEIGKMQSGRSVELRFSAYPGKVFNGVVEAISPIVNADDKTCAVHIAMNNPTEEIKPGMHAEVEIAAEIHKNKLLVPQEAILIRGGRKLVFVVENGLAKWRYVTIGLESEDFAEILPGERPEETVKEGEMVIVQGHFTLAHDAKVSIKE